MNKNKNLIILVILILAIAMSAPQLKDITGKIIGSNPGDSCDTIGERADSSQLYCDISKITQIQKLDGASCDNNFECVSSICQEDICRPGLTFGTEGETPPPPPPPGGSGSGSGGSSGGSSSRWRGAAGTCISNWTCTTWSACIGGKKTRECSDINDCQQDPAIYDKPAEEMLCTSINLATCSDGILNQEEEEVDCGGPCAQCNTCFDDEENCHGGDCELGLDCGGPCMPCKHALPIILSIITAIILIVLIILGIIYWRMKKSGEIVEEAIYDFTKTKPKSFRL